MNILYINNDKIYHSKKIFSKNFTMKHLHNHNYYELYYLLDGKRSYFIDPDVYELSVGCAVIIPPNILHRTVGETTKTHSRILLSIPCDALENEFLNEYKSLSDKYIFPISKNRRQFFESLLEKVQYEINIADSYSEYLLKKYINEIFIFLLRSSKKNEIIYEYSEPASYIRKATEYIHQNISKKITLKDIAGILNIDQTYFSKMFKKKTGCGFSDYIKKVRVTEATKLLTETNLSITEISLNIGYNDVSYFAKVFKSVKGVTPIVFRKMI